MQGMGRGVAALIAAGLAAAPAARADDAPLSPAQIALFESNHLADIAKPVVLEYDFRHAGFGGDFDDKVTADIRSVHDDGRKDVWIDFLTGPHHVNFPPALGFNGNPLLMFFLEHDVTEMGDATGGAAQYFRNRIRRAFVDQAEMHSVEITVDGKSESATEISLAPFRGDSHLDPFPGFRDKTYHFILADEVPGRIYKISTTLPSLDGTKNAFEEAMTYQGEHDETP
jgi:hypothetical protein